MVGNGRRNSTGSNVLFSGNQPVAAHLLPSVPSALLPHDPSAPHSAGDLSSPTRD